MGDGVQRVELLAAAEFPLDFSIAKVAWFSFELGEGIQARRIRQEGLQRLAISSGQMLAKQGAQALLFLCERVADRLLMSCPSLAPRRVLQRQGLHRGFHRGDYAVRAVRLAPPQLLQGRFAPCVIHIAL